MCYGKITKVWIQNEPLKAIKCVETHHWSPRLSKLDMAGGWHLAIPKIITPGGGGGVLGRSNSSAKSISAFLISSKFDLRKDAHLSGFHAWKGLDSFYLHIKKVDNVDWIGVYAKPAYYTLLYKVELRGLLQESDYGELVASEMKVIQRLDSKEY